MCDKKTLLFVFFKVKYESISLCSNFRNERSRRESTTLLQTAASLNISLVKFKAAVSQPHVLAFLVFIRNVLFFMSMRTYSWLNLLLPSCPWARHLTLRLLYVRPVEDWPASSLNILYEMKIPMRFLCPQMI